MVQDAPPADRKDLSTPPRPPFEELRPLASPPRIILFCRSKSRTRIPVHFVRAFRRAGCPVLWLNSRKLLAALGRRHAVSYMLWRLRRFRPDLVLLFSNDAPPELLAGLESAMPRAIFYEDAPPQIDPRVLELARLSTHLFTTARGLVPFFDALGRVEAHFLHAGCDRLDHRPVAPGRRFRSELAFIGGSQGEERRRLLRRLDSRFDLAVYGRGWSEVLGRPAGRRQVFPRQYRRICASSSIVIGIDCRSDLDLYFSNRTWFTLACGGFLLTRHVPGLEELFENHRHLVWFHDEDECVDLAAHYLERPSERRAIARHGAERVRRYHTFDHAVRAMISRALAATRHGLR